MWKKLLLLSSFANQLKGLTHRTARRKRNRPQLYKVHAWLWEYGPGCQRMLVHQNHQAAPLPPPYKFLQCFWILIYYAIKMQVYCIVCLYLVARFSCPAVERDSFALLLPQERCKLHMFVPVRCSRQKSK